MYNKMNEWAFRIIKHSFVVNFLIVVNKSLKQSRLVRKKRVSNNYYFKQTPLKICIAKMFMVYINHWCIY